MSRISRSLIKYANCIHFELQSPILDAPLSFFLKILGLLNVCAGSTGYGESACVQNHHSFYGLHVARIITLWPFLFSCVQFHQNFSYLQAVLRTMPATAIMKNTQQRSHNILTSNFIKTEV